jgi:hypothetical protein
VRPVDRSRREVVPAVRHPERRPGQPRTHRLLVAGVDVVRIAQVDRHHLTRAGERERRALGFPERSPRGARRRLTVHRAEPRELDPQERELLTGPTPRPAPARDQAAEQLPVLRRLGDVVRVGFALVPDHAPDRVAQQRVDHPVVDDRGHLVDPLPVRPYARCPDLHPPPPGQRTALTPGDLHVEERWVAVRTAVAGPVLDPHREHVRARPQRRGGNRVTPQLRVAVGPPHLHPVHPRDVVVVDPAQREPDPRARLLLREGEARPVPDRAVQPGEPRLLPVRGDRELHPPGIVERRVRPHRASADQARVHGRQLAQDRFQRVPDRGARGTLPLHDGRPLRLAQTQRLPAHPRLNVRTAPGAVDDPHGNADRRPQVPREVVRHRG